MTKPQQFRKKPVEIEAMQWSGTAFGANTIIDWISAGGGTATYTYAKHPGEAPHRITIETLEGTMYARPGDWILRGIQGEFYPCKPDIFEATYDRVEEDQ